MSRLRLPFEAVAPDTDESLLNGEAARDRACRLARLKAESVAANTASESTVIIGSDQVASLGDTILRKPGMLIHQIQQRLSVLDNRGQQLLGLVLPVDIGTHRLKPNLYRRRVHDC